jgi:hypothetical protein
VVSFVLLSAGKGAGVWKPTWAAVVYLTGWTMISIAGVALKADALTILVAVVLATGITLSAGAFRLWDEADEVRGQGGGGLESRASLTARGQRHVGEAPDTIRFDLGMPDPLRTIDLQSPHGRGRPVAVRFREPCDRIVRRADIPRWVRWGPPWRRRQLLVKGFSDTSLLLERVGVIPGGFQMEIYHEHG